MLPGVPCSVPLPPQLPKQQGLFHVTLTALTCLTSLTLRACSLALDAVRAIALALVHLTALAELDLSENAVFFFSMTEHEAMT
jgi:hypothetical protein